MVCARGRILGFISAGVVGLLLSGCAIAGVSGNPSADRGVFGGTGENFVADPLPEYGRPPGSEESTVEAVSGELYSLVQAQARYHDMNNTYAQGLSALAEVVDYTPGSGIRVRVIRASWSGYSATARRSPFECAVFVGSAPPPRDYARTAGIVECNKPR